MAEQMSGRTLGSVSDSEAAQSAAESAFEAQAGAAAGAGADAGRPRDRINFHQDYDNPWPRGVKTNFPYANEEIPLRTEFGKNPMLQCCDVCAIPGAGRISYPAMLRFGEDPSRDQYPAPDYTIPCCKLCPVECFPNGQPFPPGANAAGVVPPPPNPTDISQIPISEPMTLEQAKALRDSAAGFANAGSQSSFVQTADATVAAEQTAAGTDADAERGKKKPPINRGNWPRGLDPMGANLPKMRVNRCAKALGCCTMCYNHPMIYDHAPEGVW